MQVEYSPVSWTVGEPFSYAKIRQMADNDEVIQSMLLQSSLGLLGEVEYTDRAGGFEVETDPGDWNYFIYMYIYIPTSRWIKVSAIVNGLQYVDAGTYIPVRVTLDDVDELLYMRTAPGTFDAGVQSVSLSGARILQVAPGFHYFSLELGNDAPSSTDVTKIVPPGALNPTILAVEDMGGNYA